MTRKTEMNLLELARKDELATPAIAAALAGVRGALREIASDLERKPIPWQATPLIIAHPDRSVDGND
jgi:hypothetical protein